MKKNMQGFTLIELMIVVAIIAILAAIALPAYRDYTAKADITNAVAGVAGEKIKVGENHGSGKTGNDLCDGVAAAAQCNGGTLTGTSESGRSVVSVVPTFEDAADGRITWACTVTTAIVSKFQTDPCDDLN